MLNDDQRGLESQLTMWVLNQNHRRGGAVELSTLSDMAHQLASVVAPRLSDHEIEEVVVVVSTKGDVRQAPDIGIVDTTFRRWIGDRKREVSEDRWSAYKGMLISRGWAPTVVDALDRQTDDIVELMGDPTRSGPWARRGLLMGEVQSGKTATYLGTLNKAIDYGLRFPRNSGHGLCSLVETSQR